MPTLEKDPYKYAEELTLRAEQNKTTPQVELQKDRLKEMSLSEKEKYFEKIGFIKPQWRPGNKKKIQSKEPASTTTFRKPKTFKGKGISDFAEEMQNPEKISEMKDRLKDYETDKKGTPKRPVKKFDKLKGEWELNPYFQS